MGIHEPSARALCLLFICSSPPHYHQQYRKGAAITEEGLQGSNLVTEENALFETHPNC